MPTAKQIQNAKKKLKKTPKPTGNSPRLPTASLLQLIAAKRAHELAKKR